MRISIECPEFRLFFSAGQRIINISKENKIFLFRYSFFENKKQQNKFRIALMLVSYCKSLSLSITIPYCLVDCMECTKQQQKYNSTTKSNFSLIDDRDVRTSNYRITSLWLGDFDSYYRSPILDKCFQYVDDGLFVSFFLPIFLCELLKHTVLRGFKGLTFHHF